MKYKEIFEKSYNTDFKSKVYFVADTHFNHPPILKHCRRPFKDIEEHDKVQIENWNNLIRHKNDTVYIVGDFAYKDHEHYIRQLNGRKILIRGNHDNMSAKARSLFKEYFDFGLNRKVRSSFADVSRHISMCHYKMFCWENDYHVYGHSHGRLYENRYQQCCDVGVDTWGYHPIPFEVLEIYMESKMVDAYNAITYDFNEFKKLAEHMPITAHNTELHMQAWKDYFDKNEL